MALNTASDRYKEDKEGYIDIHVKIHRDDIFDALDFSGDPKLEEKIDKKPRISKALFQEIAAIMHDHMSGGDDYYELLKAAYERATGAD